MVEPGRCRLWKTAAPAFVVHRSASRTLMATSWPRRVSRARYTAPSARPNRFGAAGAEPGSKRGVVPRRLPRRSGNLPRLGSVRDRGQCGPLAAYRALIRCSTGSQCSPPPRPGASFSALNLLAADGQDYEPGPGTGALRPQSSASYVDRLHRELGANRERLRCAGSAGLSTSTTSSRLPTHFRVSARRVR